MDQENLLDGVSPMSELSVEFGGTSITSVKKKITFSPTQKVAEPKFLKSPPRTPLASVSNTLRPKKLHTLSPLMQAGLRVSTPPGRCARRFNFDENSPMIRSPSTYTVVVRQRNLLAEDTTDASSDSSYSDSFRFIEPSGFAPKKSESPRRCLEFSHESLSSDSGISEDGFSELPSQEEESTRLPFFGNNNSCTNIVTPKSRKRRSNSMQNLGKRPRPLIDRASEENKEKKGTLFQYGFTKNAKITPTIDTKSEMNIKMALQRSTQEELIGDFTHPFALPLIPGKHQDLKAISSETLSKLIKGEFNDIIESFKIIDCRYPYEFEGGHIVGAVNLYTCEHILRDLLESQPVEEHKTPKRNVLVFHCEFSSERGPFLSRFLRKTDRSGHDYPHLAYPEIYLLHGGYKTFFEDHKDLCEPQTYRTMQDPAYTSKFKLFKAKSKSWAPGSHRKQAIRSLSRLGF